MSQSHIGKYRVLAKLGQGGMARVLLTMAQGMHGFNKLLVVKELREELAHDPEFLAMFLDEARIAARLNHPNIVQTYEVGNDEERYFIAMEYLEGQPLNAIFRRVGRRNIPLEIHLRILADVLGGLEHAHKLTDYDGTPFSVVHRDVSPQNVFVTYDGSVKLVDFGIAKAAGASSRTQEGMLKGKISYIAPEQARCEEVDSRADIFAVGVMLWEALAGRRMITREDEMSVLARRMAGQDPPIRGVVERLPDELANICDRAMAADREARFQSAKEFQEVLETYLAHSDYRVTPKEVGASVTSAFEDERARIRTTIEEQVRNIDVTREPINLELVAANLKQTSDSLARISLPAHLLTSETPSIGRAATVISTPPAAPPKQHRSLLGALFAGCLLAVVSLGVVMFAFNDKKPSDAVPPATTERATAVRDDEKKEPATQSAKPAADDAAHIEIKIRYPEGARAKLDGGVVTGNPFIARVVKDDAIHRFEVDAEGFKTDKQTLMFDKNIDMTIELARESSVAFVPRPKKTAEPKEPEPVVTPQPTTPPEVPTVKKPQPTSTVEIDKSNPYKKKP